MLKRLSSFLRGKILAGGNAAEVGRNAGDFLACAEVEKRLGGFGVFRTGDQGASFGIPTDAFFRLDNLEGNLRVTVGLREGVGT